MLPTGFFAVAVGIACLVLIAVVSLRHRTRPRRHLSDGGPFFGYSHLGHDDDDYDDYPNGK
jgi:hypothetical protein